MVHSTTMYNPIPISSINRTFEHCACVQRPHSHPACAGICATWRHWTRPPGWDRGCKKAFQYFPIRTTGIENRPPGYTGVYWKPRICVNSRSTPSNLTRLLNLLRCFKSGIARLSHMASGRPHGASWSWPFTKMTCKPRFCNGNGSHDDSWRAKMRQEKDVTYL